LAELETRERNPRINDVIDSIRRRNNGLIGHFLCSTDQWICNAVAEDLAGATAEITFPPCRVRVLERIVANVAIEVPALWIFNMLVSKRSIRTRKPALRPRVVPGAEVIEAN
jgi:hypothetical protein